MNARETAHLRVTCSDLLALHCIGSAGPSVVPADGCCVSTLGDGCWVGPFSGWPQGENTGEYCAPGCVASCDAKACVRADWVGDETCDTDEGSMLTCYNNDNGDCEEDGP